jgi:hypothetical protein
VTGVRSQRQHIVGICALSSLLLLSGALYVDILLDDSVIKSRDVDFGDVTQGEAILQEFTIRNTTAQTLTVTKIFKSCHCQYLELSEGATIPAGEALTFTFGIPAPEPGPQVAKVVVTTDSVDHLLDKMVFTLRANAQRPFASSRTSGVAAL